jgi:hypothetical protein
VNQFLPLILEALGMGDPYFRFLESHGFKASGTFLKTPAFSRLMTDFRGAMQRAVQDGRIAEADILWPARVFRDKQDILLLVTFGTAPPPTDAKPVRRLLYNSEIIEIIKNHRFPISEADGTINAIGTPAAHDGLGHFQAWMESPESMAALAKYGSRLISDDARLSNSHPIFTTPIIWRLHYLIEKFETITPGNRTLAIHALSLPPGKSIDSQISYQDLIGFLNTQGYSAIASMARKLLALHRGLITPVGGSLRDYFVRIDPKFKFYLQDTVTSELLELENKLNQDPHLADLGTSFFVRERVARIQFKTLLLLQFTPDQWFDALLRYDEDIDPQSPLITQIRDSGLWPGLLP